MTTSMPTSPATSFEISKLAKTFGLFGNFPENNKLLEEIQWCQGAAVSRPPLELLTQEDLKGIISLLERLPLTGRNALAIHVLATGPQDRRDALLQQLFEYCILHPEKDTTEGDDDDFVVLLTDSTLLLDSSKYHVLQVVLLLLGFCTPSVAVTLCCRYLMSASTRHQSSFLCAASRQAPSIFSNDELYDFFRASPGKVQKDVLAACKNRPLGATSQELETRGNPASDRQDLYLRVLQDIPDLDPTLVFWCSSAYLETCLTENTSILKTLGMRRWAVHTPVYLRYIRNRLMAEASVLERGKIWKEELQKYLPPVTTAELKPFHVHALSQLLDECQVMEFFPNVPQNVQVYLRELASTGDYNLSQFEDEVRPVVLSSSVMSIIPKKERIKTAVDAVCQNDWKIFEKHKASINFHHLPFAEAFRTATPRDLWDIITGKKLNASKPFWLYFATMDFTTDNRRSFTIEALVEWANLHMRSTPAHMSTKQQTKIAQAVGLYADDRDDEHSVTFLKAQTTLWGLWYDSFVSRFLTNGLVELTTRRVSLASAKHRVQERSKVTLDARYAHELLKIGLQAICGLPSGTIRADAVIDQLNILLGLYASLQGNVLVVRNLNADLESAALKELVPRLGGMLAFEHPQGPNDQQYVSHAILEKFQTMAGTLADRASRILSQTVIHELIDSVLVPTLGNASAQDRHIRLPNDLNRYDTRVVKGNAGGVKTIFVYYDSNLHQTAISTVTQILSRILTDTKEATGENLRSDQARAWSLLFKDSYAGRDLETNNADLGQYLRFCRYNLPTWLLNSEKPLLVKRVVAYASHVLELAPGKTKTDEMNFQNKMTPLLIHLHAMGLLVQVLDECCSKDEPSINALLIKSGSFDYPIVQETIRLKTNAMDGDQRTQAHLEWLQSSFSTGKLSYIEQAVGYSAGRIRNEAGLYRRQIFDYLASNLSSVITKSLNQANDDGVTLSLTRQIILRLRDMLKNDLSRRDSIGRLGSFKNVSTVIMQAVAAHVAENSACLEELRQVWVSFAIEIHWLQVQAESGQDGLCRYKWQQSHTLVGLLPSSKQVSSSVFDEAYPRKQESFKRLDRLAKKVNIKHICADDLGRGLGPGQLITYLANGLNAVWSPSFPCGALSWVTLPKENEIRKALFDRLSTLYQIANIGWEEVPLLTETFDRLFSELEDSDDEDYIELASLHLENVLQIYGDDLNVIAESTYVYEIPRLANAIDKIFRCAVAKERTNIIQKWYKLWCSQILHRGRWDWGSTLDDARFRSFLAKYAVGCEPPACRILVDKTDISHRKAILARILLELSPSAVVKEQVLAGLEMRQDVARNILVGSEGTFIQGPFVSSGGATELDQLLYRWLTPSVLTRFPPTVSRCFAEYALKLASDTNASIATRVEAIEKFVAAPSTGHIEVMRALEMESIVGGPVQEAILIKVFSLDSPWYVVSFLLNQGLIMKEQQRMTASLLGHISKYVQVDKVVDLLGMLLDEKRRGKLTMQLHKAIIRMLFDNRTAAAEKTTKLLRSEWERVKLPYELQHILVEKCLESVVGRDEPSAAEWEWNILSSLAEQQNDVSKDILVLLFAPCCSSCSSSSVTDFLAEAENEDVLLFLRSKAIGHLPIVSLETQAKYCALLRAVEINVPDRAWKIMAKVYRLLFAVPRPDEVEDLNAVDEMKKIVMTPSPSGEWDEVDQFATRAVANLFGIVSATSLKRDELKHPTKTLIFLCNENPTAQKFRECIGYQLTGLMNTPSRSALTRKRHIATLSCMGNALVHTFGKAQIYQALVEEPFSSQLQILREDGSMLLQAIQH